MIRIRYSVPILEWEIDFQHTCIAEFLDSLLTGFKIVLSTSTGNFYTFPMFNKVKCLMQLVHTRSLCFGNLHNIPLALLINRKIYVYIYYYTLYRFFIWNWKVPLFLHSSYKCFLCLMWIAYIKLDVFFILPFI